MSSLMISLCTTGLFAACWKDMIFFKPASFLIQKLPIWIHKPLFSCNICMSSVWSVVFWLIFRPCLIYYLPVIFLIVAGINTIIIAIITPIIPNEDEE